MSKIRGRTKRIGTLKITTEDGEVLLEETA